MLKAKHGLSFIVAAVSVLLLVACGDGANAASSTPNKSSSADMEVRTYSELPTCAEKREGKTAYVKDQDQGYVCKSNEWVEDDDAVVVFSSCGTDSNSPNVVKGTFTDSRDGQTYKTVTIGTQTWMAQNLNYAYTDVPYKQGNYTSDSTSWCYKDDANNCSKYGRLYTWVAAMDSVGTWSTNGKGCGYNKTCSPTYPVRGICPEGWHLPTEAEFETLFTAVGGESTAGKVLKSTSGWNSSGNASDAFAFSVLPAGYRDGNGGYYDEGDNAYFWSSTEGNSDLTYDMALYYNFGDASLCYSFKSHGFSVRCLKD